MKDNLYGIVGVGGFGREVMPVADDMFATGFIQGELLFVTENISEVGNCNGKRVIADIEFMLGRVEDRYFNVAIADSKTRERIAERFIASGIKPFSIAALNSINLAGNEIGVGAILCPFTTLTSNIKIGKFFHANIYSYVGHDCIIGDYVTFAPDVHCNGNVVIRNHAYIGTGAIIKNGSPNNPIVIGAGAVVGMGAVVTKSIPPGVTVIGNPAAEMEKRAM